MPYIVTPTKAYAENESFGGAENLTNLQAAVEVALGNIEGGDLVQLDASVVILRAKDVTIDASISALRLADGAFATNASVGSNMVAKSKFSVVDSSMYYTMPDTSIFMWTVTKV